MSNKVKKYKAVKYLEDHLVEIIWENEKKTILSYLTLCEIYNLASIRREEAIKEAIKVVIKEH